MSDGHEYIQGSLGEIGLSFAEINSQRSFFLTRQNRINFPSRVPKGDENLDVIPLFLLN